VLADLVGDRVRVALRQLRQRPVGLDTRRDPRDVNEAVAEGARHLGVDLGDDRAGELRGRQ